MDDGNEKLARAQLKLHEDIASAMIEGQQIMQDATQILQGMRGLRGEVQKVAAQDLLDTLKQEVSNADDVQ